MAIHAAERQAVDFVNESLRLKAQSQRLQMERDDQLSAVRVEEVAARDCEERLREQQVGQASQQLAQLSFNSRLLMDGEAEAVSTGEGEVKRVELLPCMQLFGFSVAARRWSS